MKRPTTSTPISLKNKKLKTSHNIDFEQIEMICENKEKATEMIIELIIENQDLRAQLSNQSISLLNSNNFDCSIQSSVNQPENSTTNSLTSFDESILKTSFVSTNLEKKKIIRPIFLIFQVHLNQFVFLMIGMVESQKMKNA